MVNRAWLWGVPECLLTCATTASTGCSGPLEAPGSPWMPRPSSISPGPILHKCYINARSQSMPMPQVFGSVLAARSPTIYSLLKCTAGRSCRSSSQATGCCNKPILPASPGHQQTPCPCKSLPEGRRTGEGLRAARRAACRREWRRPCCPTRRQPPVHQPKFPISKITITGESFKFGIMLMLLDFLPVMFCSCLLFSSDRYIGTYQFAPVCPFHAKQRHALGGVS